MSTHSLHRTQEIPAPVEAVWTFFSDPSNLSLITPPDMGFEVLSEPQGPVIYPGQLIEYRVKPILGIPVYWMTEITQVERLRYFIDEQRFGPYRFWHHQHHFRETAKGTEMTDIVHYRNPLGFIGDWADQLFVRQRLRGIFDFRLKKVEEVFGRSS